MTSRTSTPFVKKKIGATRVFTNIGVVYTVIYVLGMAKDWLCFINISSVYYEVRGSIVLTVSILHMYMNST